MNKTFFLLTIFNLVSGAAVASSSFSQSDVHENRDSIAKSIDDMKERLSGLTDIHTIENLKTKIKQQEELLAYSNQNTPNLTTNSNFSDDENYIDYDDIPTGTKISANGKTFLKGDQDDFLKDLPKNKTTTTTNLAKRSEEHDIRDVMCRDEIICASPEGLGCKKTFKVGCKFSRWTQINHFRYPSDCNHAVMHQGVGWGKHCTELSPCQGWVLKSTETNTLTTSSTISAGFAWEGISLGVTFKADFTFTTSVGVDMNVPIEKAYRGDAFVAMCPTIMDYGGDLTQYVVTDIDGNWNLEKTNYVNFAVPIQGPAQYNACRGKELEKEGDSNFISRCNVIGK